MILPPLTVETANLIMDALKHTAAQCAAAQREVVAQMTALAQQQAAAQAADAPAEPQPDPPA